MKRNIFTIVFLLAACAAWGESEKDAASVSVSGKVHAGVSTCLNTDQDEMHLSYETNDPRLGTNSGEQYYSNVNDVSQNIHAVYGLDLKLDLHPKHQLLFSLEGTNDCEHAMGSRTERLVDGWNGDPIRSVSGTYNHPEERTNTLAAALDYTYRLRRPGSALSVGYRYRWEAENAGLEQEVSEATGWALYRENTLEQRIRCHTHHAHLDYTLPLKKGHLLDWGLSYDRRELSVHSEQDWDEVRVLDADYRHLMQYGGAHARYRLKLGPVEAMARVEYRATKMQNRWLHDVLPTATVRYHIDSIHSLSAFYTIMLIRPEVQHLDTTRITDAFTTRFGKDELVGVHVHNVALTYLAHLPKVDASAEVRFLTAKDGFNAIWMERGGNRIFTWGNEGVRYAVGLTPRVNSHLTSTTELSASATLMWDERVAEAINLRNANWGIRADMQLRQQVSHYLSLMARGDYAFHNTLDVYSYAGHGGSVGADADVKVPLTRSGDCSGKNGLSLRIGYTCLFKPDIHITQGAYVGRLAYRPGATHQAMLTLNYQW